MAALDGMRILDLTQFESGTSCTQLLAWLGADVVKLERPGVGDPGRKIFDQFGFEDSEYFVNWNSNKRSVALALDHPEGRELLLRLVPHYDVFLENLGPGVIEKLELGYDVLREIHPSVIYGSIKGFGSSGPHSSWKSFDRVAQSAGGALSVTGEPSGPPLVPGATLGDSGAGVQMALALCAAYAERLRTGEGQRVEISMQEAVTYYMRTALSLGTEWGRRPSQRTGTGVAALIDLYPCRPFGANDYVYLMVVGEPLWAKLCRAIGRPELIEDERFASPTARAKHDAVLRGVIGEWTGRFDKFEAMRHLAKEGVPASAVYETTDLYRDPHLQERGFVTTVEHEALGELPLLGCPLRLSNGDVELRAAPLLGRHTEEVLQQDLGLDRPQLEALCSAGIIARRRAPTQ